MSGDYSSIWTTGIALRSTTMMKVYGRVKKKLKNPNMTLPDAIDYALKRYLVLDK